MSNLLLNLVKRVTYSLEGTGIGKIKPLFKIYAFIISNLKPRMVTTEGSQMILDKNDSLLLSIYPNFEPAETNLVKKYIKPGMVVVDAGAYIGYFTLLMARLVGPKGEVHAFEPGKENFELLEKNVELNGYKNVICNRVALSNKVGKAKLYLSSDNPQDHRITKDVHNQKTEIIRVETLDYYFKNKKVNFIKMDIQGAEVFALEKAKETLNHKGLKIIVEFWPFVLKREGKEPKRFFDQLSKIGKVKLIDETTGQLYSDYRLDFSGDIEKNLYNLFIEV